VEERLRAPVYVRILREIMLPSVTHVFGERNFIFQDDNCHVHRARVVREFLDEQGVLYFTVAFQVTRLKSNRKYLGAYDLNYV
jgi:hypothetical protein